MTKLLTIGALGVALAVSGCSKDPGKREAGSWKTEVKVEKFEVEGLPPELKAAMDQRMQQAQTFEECLTEEQAAKEDIAGELSKNSGTGQCDWTKKDISGGKIDIAGTCAGPTGEKQELAMVGTVGPKKTDIRVTLKGPSPMGGGKMEAVMHAVGTHTGACKS
ncbi:MAG: hypothetical protein C0520_03100 [Sphingopyxis sp.]|nr:hypothetical protein [Sphingopyxis sp.]